MKSNTRSYCNGPYKNIFRFEFFLIDFDTFTLET